MGMSKRLLAGLIWPLAMSLGTALAAPFDARVKSPPAAESQEVEARLKAHFDTFERKRREDTPGAFVQYDQPILGGNDDGEISSSDQIWLHLSMWLDSNADGVATLNEMRRPEALGFKSFGTIPQVRRYVDEAGNLLPYWAWATMARAGKKTIMVDVFFLILSPTDLISEPGAKCPGTKAPHVT